MYRRNRILVLVDFSENSKNLIDFSVGLSETLNAKVMFIHQVPGIVPGMTDFESRHKIIEAEKNDAREKLYEITPDRFKNDQHFLISEKNIITILNELKTENYDDWVLAGLKGTGFLKRLFIGSTTLSIVDKSDSLTIAVPVKEKITLPTKLAIGVNKKFPLNKTQFETVLSGLKEQISEIKFFTILEENDDKTEAEIYLEQIKEEYKSFNTTSELLNGDTYTRLVDSVGKNNDTFLLLQQGSRSLQDSIFRKFMINELVYNGDTPLIVLSS
ncbi:universal stress protein [Salegentibacter sp. JZCK2]|uniref:universal stress protein n=1 Tax=Salegentibacter tibetensis TaxID=2873600 RepID=UPI001CCFDF83|nr:universal stress protein [Salegentibacter tibetensis]MBZ9729036.1 universal stress protein [Salegentibacter tibetensis]